MGEEQGKELERLRADLKMLQECQEIHVRRTMNYSPYTAHAIQAIEGEIAKLEADAADPWREAKRIVDHYESSAVYGESVATVISYVRHLESENARLTARVAELESREVPPLDQARVIRTAMEYMSHSVCKYAEWSAAEPYTLAESESETNSDATR